MSDDYVRVDGTVLEVREKSLLFSVGESVPRAGWVPRSVIHAADDIAVRGFRSPTKMVLRMREWKADELGWTASHVTGGSEHDLFQANPDMR